MDSILRRIFGWRMLSDITTKRLYCLLNAFNKCLLIIEFRNYIKVKINCNLTPRDISFLQNIFMLSMKYLKYTATSEVPFIVFSTYVHT